MFLNFSIKTLEIDCKRLTGDANMLLLQIPKFYKRGNNNVKSLSLFLTYFPRKKTQLIDKCTINL